MHVTCTENIIHMFVKCINKDSHMHCEGQTIPATILLDHSAAQS